MNIMEEPTKIAAKHVELDEVSIKVLEPLAFNVKRVYSTATGATGSLRGKHAHLNQSQLLLLCKGKAKLKLTSRSRKEYTYQLDADYVYVPQEYWIELDMAPNSLIMCLASEEYKNLESITDKEAFLNN